MGAQNHIFPVTSFECKIILSLYFDNAQCRFTNQAFPQQNSIFLDPLSSIFVYFYKVLALPSAKQQIKGLCSGQSFNDRITPNQGATWILYLQ